LLESAIENLASRPGEMSAGKVFLFTGLLANKHDFSILWPFAEDHLGGTQTFILSNAGWI
jgi:hypothetical protein